MSVQSELPGFEGCRSENRLGADAIRASIARELRYLFAISNKAGHGFGLTPAGLVHSVGVCILEDFNMSRGKGKGGSETRNAGLPTFVDVKLTEADRENFIHYMGDEIDPIKCLQAFADDGYRVGVSWSGEHQSYTVSVTCRDDESPNNGLCMTSFAGKLDRAVMLAWFKHDVICKRAWRSRVPEREEDFG